MAVIITDMCSDVAGLTLDIDIRLALLLFLPILAPRVAILV